jgi:redox-sensitive bicupin YhaK (pirin superfamily)
MQWGTLRVLNDDIIQPSRGFATHPHRDMEIITFIVDGELTHKDSTGRTETLKRGGVQFMTAGTGVRHSEYNRNANKECRIVQMWFFPRSTGLTPNYGSHQFTDEAFLDQWTTIASDVADPTQIAPVRVQQDIHLQVRTFDQVPRGSRTITKNRQGYLVCIDGMLSLRSGLHKLDLRPGDAARVHGPADLQFEATERSRVLWIDSVEA